MHRETHAPLGRRLRRSAPFIAGGFAVVLLLSAAFGIRSAATEDTPSVTTAHTDVASGVAAPTSTSPDAASASASASTVATTTSSTTSAPVPSTTPDATPTGDVVLSDSPTYGGLVTVGLVGEPTTLNPFEPDGGLPSLRAIGRAVWVGAVSLDPQTLEPAPQVANEIPSEANGGIVRNEDGSMTVRYRINPQAVWSDGTPITGADFLRTYEVATQAAGIADEVRQDYARIRRGSVLVDEATVEFTLDEASTALSSLFSILVPAHEVSVSGFSSAWDEQMWAAGGAFRFLAWDQGTQVRLVANPQAWLFDLETGDELPYLDGVRFAFYPTMEQLAEALRAGDVEVGSPDVDPVVLNELDGRSSLTVDMRYGPEWEHIAFQFGQGRLDVNDTSRTDRVALRRAIAHLLDRQALAEDVLGPYGRALDSIIGLGWPSAATPGWSIYPHDPDAAVPLLADVAATLGEDEVLSVAFATTANDPDREVIARHLVDALEGAGVAVDVALTELGSYFRDQVIPGNFEVAEWAWRAEPGPAGTLSDLRDHHVVPWPDGLDFYEWGQAGSESLEIPGVAALQAELDAVVGELNIDVLQDAARAAESILADRVVLIPLYAELNPAVAASVVGGFEHSVLVGGETSTISGWWRRDL